MQSRVLKYKASDSVNSFCTWSVYARRRADFCRFHWCRYRSCLPGRCWSGVSQKEQGQGLRISHCVRPVRQDRRLDDATQDLWQVEGTGTVVPNNGLPQLRQTATHGSVGVGIVIHVHVYLYLMHEDGWGVSVDGFTFHHVLSLFVSSLMSCLPGLLSFVF